MVSVLRNHNFSDSYIASGFASEHYRLRQDLNDFKISWIYSFGEKVMFALLVIATTGYGNVVPVSALGRAAVIVFIIIGRPIQLIMVRLLGIIFRSGLKKVLEKTQEFNRIYLPDVFHCSQILLFVPGAFYFIALLVIFVFGPAFMFARFESWSYAESVYYAFLSLASIGLGDYVAGVSSKRLDCSLYYFYAILIFFWTIVGVACITMIMNLISHLYERIILDQLDCKCEKSMYVRREMNTIYNLVADVQWNLTKLHPAEFTKERVFHDFLDLCVDQPDSITEDDLLELLEAAEELRRVATDKALEMTSTHYKEDESSAAKTTNDSVGKIESSSHNTKNDHVFFDSKNPS